LNIGRPLARIKRYCAKPILKINAGMSVSSTIVCCQSTYGAAVIKKAVLLIALDVVRENAVLLGCHTNNKSIPHTLQLEVPSITIGVQVVYKVLGLRELETMANKKLFSTCKIEVFGHEVIKGLAECYFCYQC
jgi:hypothetical protein